MEKLYLKEFLKNNPQNYDYSILKKALAMGRKKCMDELKESQLLGRGGAGFPTYKKWEFIQEKTNPILICNGDEGEPGTFKDRYIMEANPYLLLEGIFITAFMINAKEVYIYIRGEYIEAIRNVFDALAASSEITTLLKTVIHPDFELTVVKGAGAYVCGDETSLINSIEGHRPNSMIKPPYPSEKGLFGKPTIVNNVETLSNLPLIIRDGGKYYSELGVEGSRGTKLVCLSGKVNSPGIYEIEFGKVTLRNLIYGLGGGIKNNNKLKFIIPGGISTSLITINDIDTPLDYRSLKNIDTSLGSGAVIVADDTVDTVDVALSISDFFMHETCGICFPCKEGNRQIHHLLNKIKNRNGDLKYLDLIREISNTTKCAARCGLGQSSGNFIISSIDKMMDDYLNYF